jgi:hypothetical protein
MLIGPFGLSRLIIFQTVSKFACIGSHGGCPELEMKIMLTRTKFAIAAGLLLASVSAVSASEPLESTINGRYEPVTGTERSALDAYAQDRGTQRDFAIGGNADAFVDQETVRDHAKGAVPN